MRKILIPAFVICFIAFTFIVRECGKLVFERRLTEMNERIKYLHDEEGYTWDSARKIGWTEAGFIPVDDEYTALIED